MLFTPELLLFIPTFFLVSILPGMCMTLALTLGMQIGLKQTLWMMLGELTGVALIAFSAVLGISALLLQYPDLFTIIKTIGATYLFVTGFQLYTKKATTLKLTETPFTLDAKQLIVQGFITAVANPKGWVFMVTFLPPFIVPRLPFSPQLITFIVVIIIIEFFSLLIYAYGGTSLRKLMTNSKNINALNKISGGLMMLVGVWLGIS
ncbi:LysE family translocator [Algibacillus agarilyticus]|uniref:LysE family translocator n=1 Tax=Algibacillus agarilyticus TaxID=2234133 RepID=UPI000DD00665|nr:LysE family translocator [Algibacillus agarilyticus]